MTADSQGNDLQSVKYVVTSKIKLAPYDPAKRLVAAMIASGVQDPITTLGDIFADGSFVGLITSDGAPQDARDADDAIEFHQPGYQMNADPSLTLQFTVAEDNALTREMTIGKPDADDVYHVSDTVQDTKWFAYQETVYKAGPHRRRLGVVQITGNEPAQDTRGEVSGLSLTATWQKDDTVDDGNSRYLQSYYTPETGGGDTPAPTVKPVESISLSPATASVEEGKDATFTVGFTPADASDKGYTVTSSAEANATVTSAGKTVTAHGVKAGTPVTITVTSHDGGKTATATLTVTAPAPAQHAYYGTADNNAAATFTADFLKGLTAKQVTATTVKGDYPYAPNASANNGDGQYLVFALPTAFAAPKFTSSGFTFPFTKTASAVDVDGVQVDVWTSNNMANKSVTITVG